MVYLYCRHITAIYHRKDSYNLISPKFFCFFLRINLAFPSFFPQCGLSMFCVFRFFVRIVWRINLLYAFHSYIIYKACGADFLVVKYIFLYVAQDEKAQVFFSHSQKSNGIIQDFYKNTFYRFSISIFYSSVFYCLFRILNRLIL